MKSFLSSLFWALLVIFCIFAIVEVRTRIEVGKAVMEIMKQRPAEDRPVTRET